MHLYDETNLTSRFYHLNDVIKLTIQQMILRYKISTWYFHSQLDIINK